MRRANNCSSTAAPVTICPNVLRMEALTVVTGVDGRPGLRGGDLRAPSPDSLGLDTL